MVEYAIAKLPKTVTPAFPHVRNKFLQREYSCGQHTGNCGECESCRQKREVTLQHAAITPAQISERTFDQRTLHSPQPAIRQMRLSGECATLTGINTADIVAALEPGLMLPSSVRREAESTFGADFGGVRVHTDPQAADFAESIGARAFTIGQHIAFGPNAYQPNGRVGQELLRHELAHTLEEDRHMERIYGWFSRRVNKGQTPGYLLNRACWPISVGSDSLGNTHEELTEQALNQVDAQAARFPGGSRDILLWWCAELDRWKTERPQTLTALARRESRTGRPDFPELTGVIGQAGSETEAVKRLHAYGGTESAHVGIQENAPAGGGRTERTLTGRGVIGTLLEEAVRKFEAGALAHGLRLLGISLHTIQDYYAHHVPLRDQQGRDLRQVGSEEAGGGQAGEDNVSVLVDDPNLDRTRWSEARSISQQQLQRFYGRIRNKDQLRNFRSSS